MSRAEQGAGPDVVVCGNLTVDDVVRPDGAVTLGVAGGNVLHGALGARLWTRSLGLVTRAGDDAPAAALDAARAAGIALAGVVRVPGPTVRCWVLYEEDGRRTFVSRTPPARYDEVALRPEDIPAAWLPGVRAVHVAAMRPEAAEGLVERLRAEAPAAAIVLDTHEDFVTDTARMLALAARVSVFCPSRDELAQLAGEDAPERTAPALAARTGTPIVAKLGPDGCVVAVPGEAPVHVPSAARAVVDPTGAGDAFCGGLAAALAGGHPLVEAARRASASAALALAGHGSARFDEAAREDAGPPAPLPAPEALPSAAAADGGGRSIHAMRREIDTIPQVIADQLTLLGEPLRELADELAARAVEHVVLTGCGDSAFAGQASALCFSRHAGVGVRAVHALDLARYEMRYLPPNCAVVCVSYSGKVGRTIEAAMQAREFGHLAVALTGDGDNRLAAACDRVLPLTVPTAGLSPGTSTYVAMVTALADLALRWGGARGLDVDGARAQLESVPGRARDTLAAAGDAAAQLGRDLAGRPWVCMVGSGPNEASARFGAAKLLEGPQVLGTSTNVEEWAHEEYFLTAPGTPVIVVAPAGSADDRVADVLDELVAAGADAALVSDRPAPAGVRHLPLAGGLPEELSPLLAALPLSVAAFALAELTGKRSYNFAGPEAERRHYETIHAVRLGVPA